LPTTSDGSPQPSKAALYFCCMEAVQNAVKHSRATTVTVHLAAQNGQWRLAVTDDGTGFDPARAEANGTGAGLANMRDRLDAVGGTVTLRSRPGSGATMTRTVPCAARTHHRRDTSPFPAGGADVRARVAWGFVALATVSVLLDTAFTAAHLSLTSEAAWADHGWPLLPLSGAGCALMGALVISRFPRQPLGGCCASPA
jgi:hypothetical protein